MGGNMLNFEDQRQILPVEHVCEEEKEAVSDGPRASMPLLLGRQHVSSKRKGSESKFSVEQDTGGVCAVSHARNTELLQEGGLSGPSDDHCRELENMLNFEDQREI